MLNGVTTRGRTLLLLGMVIVLATVVLRAQAVGVLGDWTEPTGSVIHIGRCDSDICMWVVSISRQAPSTKDIYNPDPAMRTRSLCGLKIGSGFVLRDPDHATDGTLYDPKTGKTYHGMVTAKGGTLSLRGYIGIPLFGRSQMWTRASPAVKGCVAEPDGR